MQESELFVTVVNADQNIDFCEDILGVSKVDYCYFNIEYLVYLYIGDGESELSRKKYVILCLYNFKHTKTKIRPQFEIFFLQMFNQ